jgi:hypothetical protein
MFEERALEAVKAAAVLEMITETAEREQGITLRPECCKILDRLLRDAEYRIVANDVWRELFRDGNADKYEKVIEYLKHSTGWNGVLMQ